MLKTPVTDSENRPDTETRSAENIDTLFHKMLEADRNSKEFADLWDAVDSFICEALGTKRSVAA